MATVASTPLDASCGVQAISLSHSSLRPQLSPSTLGYHTRGSLPKGLISRGLSWPAPCPRVPGLHTAHPAPALSNFQMSLGVDGIRERRLPLLLGPSQEARSSYPVCGVPRSPMSATPVPRRGMGLLRPLPCLPSRHFLALCPARTMISPPQVSANVTAPPLAASAPFPSGQHAPPRGSDCQPNVGLPRRGK